MPAKEDTNTRGARELAECNVWPLMHRRIIIAFAAALLVALAAVFALSRPRPVGQLTAADLHTITNVIRAEIAEQIMDIRPRDTVVVIDTGRDGVCYHCFELERTRNGWKVTWKGT
jgi:hypothetical protein